MSPDPTAPTPVRSAEDISIYSWKNGWNTIVERKDESPEATDATEYPKVFGIPYVKSTVTNYKRYLRGAPTALIDQFYAYGDTREGSFKHFIFAYRKNKSASASTVQLATSQSNVPQPIQIASTTSPVPDIVPKAETVAATIPPLAHPIYQISQEDQRRRATASVIDRPTRQLQEIRLPSPIPEDTPEEKELDRVLEKHQGLFNTIMEQLESEKRLCPFCDQPLPISPSQKLLTMQKRLESLSTLDPLPDNPLHRRCQGGFTTYIDFCALHNFEAEELPNATSNGWLLNPDFKTLYDRVCRAYLFFATVSKSNSNVFLNAAKDFYDKDKQEKESARGQYESGRFEQAGAG